MEENSGALAEEPSTYSEALRSASRRNMDWETLLRESGVASSPGLAPMPRPPFPEYMQFVRSYSQSIQNYNRTVQTALNLMVLQSAQQPRPRHRHDRFSELENIMYDYNHNIQDYNEGMMQSMTLLRDLYRVPRTQEEPSAPTHSRRRPVSAIITYTLSQMQGTAASPSTVAPLTPEDIQTATEEYVYHRPAVWTPVPPPEPISSVTPEPVPITEIPVCPIGLDEFQEGESILRILQCGHQFKTAALQRWLHRSDQCPVCRCSLRPPPDAEREREGDEEVTINDISLNSFLRDFISTMDRGNRDDVAFTFSYDVSNHLMW